VRPCAGTWVPLPAPLESRLKAVFGDNLKRTQTLRGEPRTLRRTELVCLGVNL
jgi:hypothetical protein